VGLGIGCRVLGVFLGLLSQLPYGERRAVVWELAVKCEWFHLGFYDHYFFLFNNKVIIFSK
jgi:hypothetical protein